MKDFLFFFSFLFLLSGYSQEGLDQSLKVGDTLPAFELPAVEGPTINSKDLEGEVIFLNLWFRQCKPCVLEMPALNELKEKYEDDIKFISMVIFSDKKGVEEFLKIQDFNFTHLYNSREYVQNKLNVNNFPTTYLSLIHI